MNMHLRAVAQSAFFLKSSLKYSGSKYTNTIALLRFFGHISIGKYILAELSIVVWTFLHKDTLPQSLLTSLEFPQGYPFKLKRSCSDSMRDNCY